MKSLFWQLNRCNIRWRSSNGTLWVCCPFCLEHGESLDTKFRLGIQIRAGKSNVPVGTGHCFNCHFKSRRALLLLFAHYRIEDLDFSDIGNVEPLVEKVESEPLPADFDFADRDREAMLYLLGRGLTPAQVNKWGVGSSRVGRASFRVIFPKWVGDSVSWWAARDWSKVQKPPWLMSRGPKGLYGTVSRSVVLVEGIFDMLAVERAGYDAVALLGTVVTDSIDEELATTDRIVLWTDPDRAGHKAIKQLAKRWLGSKDLFLVDATVEPGDIADERKTAAFVHNAKPLTLSSLWAWQMGLGDV